jgi:two-component system, OmpR family, sensor kinase
VTTIRRRLTLWYTVALGVTVLAFGTLLYLERRQSSLRELDQRLGLEADLAKRWLSESYNVLGRIVTTAGSSPSLDPGISAYLEAVRDYLIVTDSNANVLALSEAARSLNADALERLTSQLDSLHESKRVGTLSLGPGAGSVRFFALRVEAAGPEIGGLLVATSTTQVAFGPTELLRSMLLIAPIVLLGAALVGSWLAGTSLRPVEGIMDEVDAISDGTSLHRRLAVPMS